MFFNKYIEMFWLLATLLFIYFIYFIYKFVYLTRKKFNWYVKILKDHGYRVYDWKYSLVGIKVLKKYKLDFSQYGDGFYTAKISMLTMMSL